jgi:flagellar hook-associated protein 2
MAGNASISGLASGLDTATIISQLMQLEAIPQNRLKTQITTHQSAMSKLQELNTKIAALATKAADLAKEAGWTPVTPSSSYDKVTISATAGAAPGQVSFTVVSTAKPHLISMNTTYALTDVVVSNPQRNVRLDMMDGTVHTVNTGDGTLQGLINAINSSAHGVRASTVQLADGKHRLRLESTTPGATSNFTLTTSNGQALMGGPTVDVVGSDAQIRVGADTLYSTSNTFANVLPGMNVTLSRDAVPNTVVTATLTSDPKTMAASVKSLVDALNSALSDIDALTATAVGKTKAGVLAGDSRLRSERDKLVNTLYSTADRGLADVGIQLDRTGKFVFNEATFSTAYQSDPIQTARKFTAAATDTGFADRVAKVATLASRTTDGTITQAITGRKSSIDRLEDSVAAWDLRLELRRTTLTRQFTALETALGRMNSQSSWLAGQISSLPTSSS